MSLSKIVHSDVSTELKLYLCPYHDKFVVYNNLKSEDVQHLLLSHSGGHHPNHEDAEKDQQCPAADRTCGDPKEHVSASKEDDQGAD